MCQWKDQLFYTPCSSESKYESGTGWPSFSQAHGTWERDESHASIVRRPDNSLGNTGTEVLCKHVIDHSFPGNRHDMSIIVLHHSNVESFYQSKCAILNHSGLPYMWVIVQCILPLPFIDMQLWTYWFVNARVLLDIFLNVNKLFCFGSAMDTLVMCLTMDQTQPVTDSVSTVWL